MGGFPGFTRRLEPQTVLWLLSFAPCLPPPNPLIIPVLGPQLQGRGGSQTEVSGCPSPVTAVSWGFGQGRGSLGCPGTQCSPPAFWTMPGKCFNEDQSTEL